MKLTCALTADAEFSHEQLNSFKELMAKEHISAQNLADNSIVQSCMKQGNFTETGSYIQSDAKLKTFLSDHSAASERNMAKIATLRAKISNKNQEGALRKTEQYNSAQFFTSQFLLYNKANLPSK